MDDKAKKIVGCLATILTLIFIVVDVCWVCWRFFGTDKKTLGVVYAQSVKDASGKEYPIMRVNQYENEYGNGLKMVELQLSYYTDYDKSAVEQRTFQWFYEYAEEDVGQGRKQQVPINVWEYKGDTNVDWASEAYLAFGEPMFVEIDGEMYSFALTGTYDKITYTRNLLTVASDWVTGIFNFNLDFNDIGIREQRTETQFKMTDVIEKISKSIVNSSEGYGDYSTFLFDFSQFFTFEKFNKQTGKFEAFQANQKFLRNYFGIEVHRDRFGVKRSYQSLVDMVKNDRYYDTSGLGNANTDTWSTGVNLTLDNSAFKTRSSTYYGGELLSLKEDVSRYMHQFDDVTLNVVIDLDEFEKDGKNVVGLDSGALNNLNVKTVTIKSNKPRTFKMLDYALANTNLKTVYKTRFITIDWTDLATNEEYVEVIING